MSLGGCTTQKSAVRVSLQDETDLTAIHAVTAQTVLQIVPVDVHGGHEFVGQNVLNLHAAVLRGLAEDYRPILKGVSMPQKKCQAPADTLRPVPFVDTPIMGVLKEFIVLRAEDLPSGAVRLTIAPSDEGTSPVIAWKERFRPVLTFPLLAGIISLLAFAFTLRLSLGTGKCGVAVDRVGGRH